MTKQHSGGLIAVHAHPDDESITMGATLARYAALGLPVTLVTATLGECGETMRGALDGLDAQHADQLGGYRFAEWQAACRALGIRDGRILGGVGTFRDSGMAGEPGAGHPRAFIRAQRGGQAHDSAVAALAAVLDEVRPAVVVTYDETGGYGHPDHIAAHDVTAGAVAACGSAGLRFAEVVKPRGALASALERLWAAPLPDGYARPDIGELGTLSDSFDIAVPAAEYAAARRAGMAAHATQLDVWAGEVDGFALTNLKAQPLLPHEHFRIRSGPPAPPGATDLFAGL